MRIWLILALLLAGCGHPQRAQVKAYLAALEPHHQLVTRVTEGAEGAAEKALGSMPLGRVDTQTELPDLASELLESREKLAALQPPAEARELQALMEQRYLAVGELVVAAGQVVEAAASGAAAFSRLATDPDAADGVEELMLPPLERLEAAAERGLELDEKIRAEHDRLVAL